MRYNTNLFEQVVNVPTPYIEVNQRSSENKSGDKGSIIVRFDWATHIKFMEKTHTSFPTLLSTHFSPYLGTKSGDFGEINRLVNESLVQARVTLSNTLGGNSASMVLENFDNRWIYGLDILPDLYGTCVFSEGIYVTIDAKGRFYSDRYCRIFTGVINQINETDNPTDRRITLSLTDYSRFLRYTRYNIHPAISDKDVLSGNSQAVIWTNRLADKTNIDIAKELIPDTKRDWKADKVNLLFKDAWTNQKIEDSYFTGLAGGLGDIQVVDRNFMWSFLVKNSSYDSKNNVHKPLSLLWGDVKPKSETNYQVYANIFGKFSLFTAEFKTRADILNETTVATFFVCYIDGAGNIHYHPPRYEYVNIRNDRFPHVLGLFDEEAGRRETPFIYVLLEEESLDESYIQNEEDIVTRLFVNLESDFGILRAIGKADPNLARLNIIWAQGIQRYGLRERSVSSAAFGDVSASKVFGLALFVRLLLERKKMSTTMPMRAELQVDRPFYVPHKNMVYHIRSLTHTYSAGGERSPGTYTTTVDCFGGRPLEHSAMLVPNLFKESDFKTVIKTFSGIGYDISVNTLTKEQLKKLHF